MESIFLGVESDLLCKQFFIYFYYLMFQPEYRIASPNLPCNFSKKVSTSQLFSEFLNIYFKFLEWMSWSRISVGHFPSKTHVQCQRDYYILQQVIHHWKMQKKSYPNQENLNNIVFKSFKAIVKTWQEKNAGHNNQNHNTAISGLEALILGAWWDGKTTRGPTDVWMAILISNIG